MDEIQRQVAKARRRLNAQQLLAVLPWTLFAGLLLAAVGVAIPKIWFVQADPTVWFWSWTGGAIAFALIAAGVLAAVYRRGVLEAAIELDRRFGLKERVSTTLALTADERQSEIGQALVADAVRRVERVAVAEQFPLQMKRPALLPLIPALAVVGLLLVDNAQPANAKPTAGANAAEKEKVKVITAAKKLQDKLKEKEKKREEEGLKDADVALKELQKKLNDMTDKMPDKKEALVKLNDLAKDLADKKSKLPSSAEMKKQLEKLTDLEKGPADKVADAMKEGDLGKAKEELNKLKDQLAKGELGKEDKEKLAEQLEKMKEKIEEKQRERQQAKEDLKKEIEKKKNEGDAAEAGKLQQKLDEMEAKDKAMEEQIREMAEKFGDCAECMKKGGAEGEKQAAAKMGEIAEEMEKLEKQIAEAQELEELEGDLAEAKEAMKGAGKDGEEASDEFGDGDQEGQGKGKGKGDKPGNGMGEGNGKGRRPESETDKKFYDARVRNKMKAGEAKRIGDAGGPNIAGKSKAEIQAEVAAGESREAEAIDDQPLSREQKEHAKQYFQRLRGAE